MSRLRGRIMSQAAAHALSMGSYHPHGTAETPMVMPMTLTTYAGGGAFFQELTAVTAGAPDPERAATMVPGSSGGSWGRTRPAGRP